MQFYCKKCGALLPQNLVCKKCGTRLETRGDGQKAGGLPMVLIEHLLSIKNQYGHTIMDRINMREIINIGTGHPTLEGVESILKDWLQEVLEKWIAARNDREETAMTNQREKDFGPVEKGG